MAERGYSRTQWSNLSIQERIKAMNQNLGDQTLDTTAAPRNNIPKRNKSVVDIWRNNAPDNNKNSASNDNNHSLPPAPLKKPESETEPVDRPAPKRPTIASASPTPPQIPRVKNCSVEAPDITVIPAGGNASGQQPTTASSSSRIKNVSKMWESMSNNKNNPATQLPKVKRQSVVEMWNRQRNDSVDEQEKEVETVPSASSPASPQPISSRFTKSFDSFEGDNKQEEERPPITRMNSKTFEKQEKLLNRFMAPQDNGGERPKWTRQNSLERGSTRITPANSWIDKEKNAKPISPQSPKPVVATPSDLSSTSNHQPPSSPAFSRPPIGPSGSWFEKQNSFGEATKESDPVSKRWQPKTSVSERRAQRNGSGRSTSSKEEDTPFEFQSAVSSASGSWSQKDLDTPASPKANEKEKQYISPGGGRAASLRNMFEKQGETKTVQHRWAKRVGRATEKKTTEIVSAPQESMVTTDVSSADGAVNNVEESPKLSPWPSLRKTGPSTPKAKGADEGISDDKSSVTQSPWPALRKTGSARWQKTAPALPNLDDSRTANEVVDTSNSEEAKTTSRRKVTDRYTENVVPRVDTAVSDLVKQHVSRTPVGKSINKQGRFDDHEIADEDADPPIVAFPEESDDTDEDEAFHRMIVENNRVDLDDKKSGSRLSHSEPVVPIKVDDSLSELIKKHGARTPSGRTRKKIAGLWNSSKDLDTEGGLEVERVSESQTETETEIREVDPVMVQESAGGKGLDVAESTESSPSPSKQSMAAERWQKRLEKKALAAPSNDSEATRSSASPRGKVTDRWIQRVASSQEGKNDSVGQSSSTDMSPNVSRCFQSDRDTNVIVKEAPKKSIGATHGSVSNQSQEDKPASDVLEKTSQDNKKKTLMQLGRKHAVNRFSAPSEQEKELPTSKFDEDAEVETEESKPMSPSELIKNLNSSSSKGSSSFDSSRGSRKTGIPSYSPGTRSVRGSKADTQTERGLEKGTVAAGATSAITQRIAKERLFSKKRLQSQRRRKVKPVDETQTTERVSKIPPPKTSGLTVLGLSKNSAGETEKALSDFSLPSEGDFGDILATGSTLSSSSLANKAEKVLQRRRRKSGSKEENEVEKEVIQEPENVNIDDDFHDYYDGQDQAAEALQKIQKSLDENAFMDKLAGISHRPHGGFEDPSFEEQDSLVQETQFDDGPRRLTTRYNNATRFMDESAAGDSIESSLLSHDSVTTGSFARYDDSKPSRQQRHSKGQSGRENRSVNTSANQSAWDPTNLDVSSLVSFDFKKIASAVDEQVSALRDLVGQQMTPRGTQTTSSNVREEVEDVAIEVEYVEDTSSEPDPGSDHGVYAPPESRKAVEAQRAPAESDMIPGEPSFEQQPTRRGYV